MNIHKIQIKSTMFESSDDFIVESHFWEVAAIDSKGLTVVRTTEAFVQKVLRKLLTQLHNLHMI